MCGVELAQLRDARVPAQVLGDARSRAARPIRSRRSGRSSRTRIARASSPGRSGATSRPCSPSVDQLAHGREVGGDDGHARGHRLEDLQRRAALEGVARAVAQRRQREQRVLAPARELGLGQRELPAHAVGDPEPLGELAVAAWRGAGAPRRRSRARGLEVAQPGERAQRGVDALPRLQRAEVQEVALAATSGGGGAAGPGRRRRCGSTCSRSARRARAAARRSPPTGVITTSAASRQRCSSAATRSRIAGGIAGYRNGSSIDGRPLTS